MRTQITNKFALLLVSIIVLGMTAFSSAQTQQLEWYSFEEALAIADSTNRPILVDVWAPWCGWCLKMKRSVYPKLAPEITDNFVLTRINRDNTETIHRYKGEQLSSLRLAQQLNAQSVPTVVLLTENGDYLLHITGFVEAEQLRPLLEYIGSGAYRQVSFNDYQNNR